MTAERVPHSDDRSRFAFHVSRFTHPLILLFTIDFLTNVADYAFHVYLGRALPPGEFAVVQAVNAALLIILTTFGVMQPVVARHAAGASEEEGRAAFQGFFWQSVILGLFLSGLVWLGQQRLGGWLDLPPTAISLSALMLLVALARPVVAGMLQGEQRFVAFGLMRGAFSFGRLALALLLVGGLSGGALAGVATMPLAGLASLLLGLLLLGRAVWQRAPRLSPDLLWAGWRLSLAALLAYGAYMSLLNLDLLWVNGRFSPTLAGSYGAAVVLRRVLALLPGAAVVIFYPRAAALVGAGQRPDELLWRTGGLLLGATGLLAVFYFIWPDGLIRLLFGPSYDAAAPLLGLMGLGMVGYGLSALWLNLFLASRPWPFVLLLIAVAGLQALLLAQAGMTLMLAAMIFSMTGWLLALGGLLLYWMRLRPQLV